MDNEEHDSMVHHADAIAKVNPSILIDALRNNGVYVFPITKEDVQYHADSVEEYGHLGVITDADMGYVNEHRHNIDDSLFPSVQDFMRSIFIQIQSYRNAINQDHA